MKYVLAIFLAGVMSVAAMAQTTSTSKLPAPAEMAARQVKRLTTLLSLTSAQKQQATSIFTEAAQAEQTARAGDKEAHDSLTSAIKTNDVVTIDQVANTLALSSAQATSIKARADAAFYQILSADQQTKLSELDTEHMGLEGGGGGPGGPPAMGFR